MPRDTPTQTHGQHKMKGDSPALLVALDEGVRAHGAHQELGAEEGQSYVLQHLRGGTGE